MFVAVFFLKGLHMAVFQGLERQTFSTRAKNGEVFIRPHKSAGISVYSTAEGLPPSNLWQSQSKLGRELLPLCPKHRVW